MSFCIGFKNLSELIKKYTTFTFFTFFAFLVYFAFTWWWVKNKDLNFSYVSHPKNNFFKKVKDTRTKTIIVFSEEFDKDFWIGLKEKRFIQQIKMVGDFKFSVGVKGVDPRDPHEDVTKKWYELEGIYNFNLTIIHWEIEKILGLGFFQLFETYMYVFRYTRRSIKIEKLIESSINKYSGSIYDNSMIVYFDKKEWGNEFYTNVKSYISQ